ncbi:hypothetical protein HDV00_012790, partial [Rhizophlyctis rosea]
MSNSSAPLDSFASFAPTPFAYSPLPGTPATPLGTFSSNIQSSPFGSFGSITESSDFSVPAPIGAQDVIWQLDDDAWNEQLKAFEGVTVSTDRNRKRGFVADDGKAPVVTFELLAEQPCLVRRFEIKSVH